VRPIEHGADIVVHSLTKFIGGHGNSIGGVIIDGGTFDWSKSGNYPMLSEPRPEYGGVVLHETFGNFAFAIACAGARPARLWPGDFAVQRLPDPDKGLETLPLRMQKQCDNAQEVAEWLSKHPRSPGCPIPAWRATRTTSCSRNIRRKGAGAVFTFGLKGGYDAGVKVVEGWSCSRTRQSWRRALAGHPPGLDDAPPADRRAEGGGRRRPDVVRLSIGIEDVADIIAIWSRRWPRRKHAPAFLLPGSTPRASPK
jgi:O-acetylhomoserine (thiol)-lyase